MVDDLKIGYYAMSTAGHDAGRWYVILGIENEYGFLSDGKIRTLDHPKRKKMKHMQICKKVDSILKDKLIQGCASNEEIKRTLKLFQKEILGKEVE
ncbi:MAG: hypothetical protein GX915_09455 [Clostridiales bacterium]|nr:hypothetical protein [Clostridiales bacterium]